MTGTIEMIMMTKNSKSNSKSAFFDLLRTFYFDTPRSARAVAGLSLIQLSISPCVATAITPIMPMAFTPASLLTAALRLGSTIIHPCVSKKLCGTAAPRGALSKTVR